MIRSTFIFIKFLASLHSARYHINFISVRRHANKMTFFSCLYIRSLVLWAKCPLVYTDCWRPQSALKSFSNPLISKFSSPRPMTLIATDCFNQVVSVVQLAFHFVIVSTSSCRCCSSLWSSTCKTKCLLFLQMACQAKDFESLKVLQVELWQLLNAEQNHILHVAIQELQHPSGEGL